MIEKEYKWITGEGFDIAPLLERLSNKAGKKIYLSAAGNKEYYDRYYDTKDFTLFRAGFGCRLRISDDQKIEIKFQPKKSGDNFLTRKEWLIDRKEKKSKSAGRFEDKKVRDFFLEEFSFIVPGDLKPVIMIKDIRSKWEIKYSGAIFELSLDHSESHLLMTGNNESAISHYKFTELELESVQESERGSTPFLEVGALISKEKNLKLSGRNKLERSLTAFSINSRKQPAFVIKGDDKTSETAKKIIGYYFKTTVNNIQGAQIGIDDEYIHDMRVAIRKLRTALQFFEFTLTSVDFNYFKNNLRWIALTLGRVRDIDVFSIKIRNFIPQEILHNNNKLMDIIKNEIARIREERRSVMFSMLHSFRFKHFLERTAKLIGSDFQRLDNLSISKELTRKTAQRILIRTAADTVKSAALFEKDYENTPDNVIHKLRIRFKRLRYSLDFFIDLLTSKEKKFYDLIPPIQDILGAYVDTFFISELIGEIIKKIQDPNYKQEVSFILKGMAAAVAEWKHEQRFKLYEIISRFSDSAELADFLENVNSMIIR